MSTIRFAVGLVLSLGIVRCCEAREWTDSTGVFSVEAEFVEISQSMVRLRKRDGVVVQVPLERFSETDRHYLSTLPGVDIPTTNQAILRIDKALRSKPALEFAGTPLEQVAGFLAEQAGIDIDFDIRALDSAGIAIQTPVTITNTDRTLADVLDALLNPLRLAWIVRHDVVLITTPVQTKAAPVTRVYVSRGGQDSGPLVQDISANIAARSWGPGGSAIRQVSRAVLLINQTQPRHRSIEKRYADKLKVIHPTDMAVPPHAFCTALNAALNKCVPVGFIETPLDKVAAFLAASSGVQISFDRQALNDAGMSQDVPVTRLLKHARFRCVLDLILADLELTWIPADTGILITTPERATEMVEVEFDVRGLTPDPFIVDLSDALKNTVAPQNWHHPGASMVRHPEKPFILAVRNCWGGHWQLAQVIQDLRQAGR
jgi:hypothetical protein